MRNGKLIFSLFFLFFLTWNVFFSLFFMIIFIRCVYGDFVKLYLHLNEYAINEKTPWNQVICGKIADIEQTHYSSDSCLMFEFHSDWRNGNNTGFRGTYRFLDKSKSKHFLTKAFTKHFSPFLQLNPKIFFHIQP